MNKGQADAMMRRAICDWGDYVSRWSFVEDVTGDLAVVIESATHDEVLVVSSISESISELDTYIAANLVPTVTLYSGLKSSLIYLTMRQLLPVADYPMTMILNSS